ncbi:MAG: AAA family ATPase [Phycisphaerae bacterium]|nr:AAA family ATPase [Phycisphaerae bacterium]
MYLKRFKITGIKCFEELNIHFPHDGDDYSGWIVLLGGNGMGKSTLLQSMALSLVEPLVGQRLLLSPVGWVREGRNEGTFDAEIVRGENDAAAGQPRKTPYEAKYVVTGTDEVTVDNQEYDQPQIVLRQGCRKSLGSGPHAAKRSGWFSCGYGPFRRLLGGASDEAKLIYTPGRQSRFVTLFREAAALVQCTEWLTSLYNRSQDPANLDRQKASSALGSVRDLINGLLPDNVRIERVDSEQVYFQTVGGAVVPVLDLSDGFRSFLALAIDVLRHIQESGPDFAACITNGREGPQVNTEGIVLIDEVDAHLHPVWQRSIGAKLCRTFPKMQFIVSSHSPFVAQAAAKNGLVVLRSTSESTVELVRDFDSVKGWRVDQILTSPLFGLSGTRDYETEDLIKQQTELVAKRQWEQLGPEEQSTLATLEAKLADRLTGPGETAGEFKRQSEMKEYVDRTVRELGTSGG